ncbi:MAG: hypothetical protein LBS22_02230 [Puniceicoccales bacterium]|nr:hypothetical protein [Puniceicoccales bacterium]
MRRVERTPSVHSYGQLGTKSLEKASTAAKVGDSVVVGDKAVGIPPRKVPEDALAARSAVADVPPGSTIGIPAPWQEAMKRNTADLSKDAPAAHSAVADTAPRVAAPPVVVPSGSTVTFPTSWLEFTVENIANLTEDEIGKRLLFRGRFDASKFAIMLFLPKGHQIVTQLINGMSGDCLLRSIGGNVASADHFRYILSPEDYFTKIAVEAPTVGEMEGLVRLECEPLPQGFPRERFEELVTVVARAIVDTYVDEGRREQFESNLRKIVDSIFSKLPPPDATNREYWKNICEAVIEETVGEDGEGGGEDSEDGEGRLVELEEKYPSFMAAMKIAS